MNFEAILNPSVHMQSGAGPKAAETIINHGAEVLLTGRVGDKAETALKKGGIKIVDGFNASTKVKDAFNSYLSK